MGLLQPDERHRRRHGSATLTAQNARGPVATGPKLPPGPPFLVHGCDDVRRIAAVSRALDRPALVVSNGAIGWHLFAAMIHASEPEDTALSFLFDAGEGAGQAAEALRSGARLVLSRAPAPQWSSLQALADSTGATLLHDLDVAPLDCSDVAAIKQILSTWQSEGRTDR